MNFRKMKPRLKGLRLIVVRTGLEPACGPCVYFNYIAVCSTPFHYSGRLPIPPPDYAFNSLVFYSKFHQSVLIFLQMGLL